MQFEPILIPKKEILARLQYVKTTAGFYPYMESPIKWVTLPPKKLKKIRPCQTYVTGSALARAQEIYLHEGLWAGNYGCAFETYTHIPPIIEESDGVAYIADGTHRVYYSIQLNSPLSVIVITNPQIPYYSHPVHWDDVVYYRNNRIPEGVVKRHYNGPEDEARLLYRDFNAMFPNIQPSRRTCT